MTLTDFLVIGECSYSSTPSHQHWRRVESRPTISMRYNNDYCLIPKNSTVVPSGKRGRQLKIRTENLEEIQIRLWPQTKNCYGWERIMPFWFQIWPFIWIISVPIVNFGHFGWTHDIFPEFLTSSFWIKLGNRTFQCMWKTASQIFIQFFVILPKLNFASI